MNQRFTLRKRQSFFTILLLSCTFLGNLTHAQTDIVYGKASYYADFFHGRKTASGEIFNQNELTAAHLFLPFGTKLKVTNPDNQHSVIVRVNDRGPYVRGRMIDLSKAAANELDIVRKGVSNVVIETLSSESDATQYAMTDYPLQNASFSEERYGKTYSEEQSYYISNNPYIESLVISTTPEPATKMTTDHNVRMDVNFSADDYIPSGPFLSGKAWVYEDAYEGRKTANGETYNSAEYTASHNQYPAGTYLKVTRKNNPNLSIVVRVNDKSPKLGENDIQLSWAAAQDLDILTERLPDVVMEQITMTDLDALPEPTPAAAGTREIEIDFTQGSATSSNVSTYADVNSISNRMRPTIPQQPNGLGLFKLEVNRVPQNGYGVQIVAISDHKQLLEIADRLHAEGFENLLIHSDIVNSVSIMRLIVGPFEMKDAAEACKAKLAALNVPGIIMRLEPLK